MTVDDLTDHLRRHTYRFTCEKELHRAISTVLDRAQISYRYEDSLTKRDRPDFTVGPIAIEVKVDGSLSSVTMQLHRYARLPDVEALVLVTSKAKHAALPRTMAGKPVRIVHVGRGL